MIFSESRFRPDPLYPTYPPYHKGPYLEDYFFNRFSEDIPCERAFIGVSWTTLYCDNKAQGLQEFLDGLPEGKYFTICQHDDGPRERLPNDTLVFSASQAVPKPEFIQIPVAASRIGERDNTPRDIFASFVGSYTHQIRIEMMQGLQNNYYEILLSPSWSPSVAEDRLNKHIDSLRRSDFALCPRGYGNTSFRMYEAMQLGAVPVYISDDFCLPWSDEIDWNDLVVLIKREDISKADEILTNFSYDRLLAMRAYAAEIYEDYFSLSGTYNNIMKRLR